MGEDLVELLLDVVSGGGDPEDAEEDVVEAHALKVYV
jgi:hypothetical protein